MSLHVVLLRLGTKLANFLNSLFRFLTLPAEVRNQIYQVVVETHIDDPENAIENPTYANRPVAHNRQQIAQPVLFQVCRQIRLEGLPFFYSMSKFNLIPIQAFAKNYSNRSLWLWLKHIRLANTQHIRHLHIHIFRRNSTSTASIQSLMLSLKRYHLPNATITLEALHPEQAKHLGRLVSIFVDAFTSFTITIKYLVGGSWKTLDHQQVQNIHKYLGVPEWKAAIVSFTPPTKK